jgi:regulator of cell morphogenesis and NO signaling
VNLPGNLHIPSGILNAAHLARLETIVSELSAGLLSHMRKQELVLLPAIRAIEEGHARPGVRIDAPIAALEHEHDHAGALRSELWAIADGYFGPISVCETFGALYHGVSELEATMQVHGHLENNILFPRALALAGMPAEATT